MGIIGIGRHGFGRASCISPARRGPSDGLSSDSVSVALASTNAIGKYTDAVTYVKGACMWVSDWRPESKPPGCVMCGEECGCGWSHLRGAPGHERAGCLWSEEVQSGWREVTYEHRLR